MPAPRPSGHDRAARIAALDHPSLSVRLESQRMLATMGTAAVPDLIARLKAGGTEAGRLHAIWALDAIGGPEARRAIDSSLADASSRVRLQAARSAGIRRDRDALPALSGLLKDRDAAVRREAAIAIGKVGDPAASGALYAALDESDRFAAWSVRGAIRRLDAWDKDAIVSALLDQRRAESALELTDEAWAVPVAEALTEALRRSGTPAMRARIVANLAGLFRQYPEWSGAWFGTNPLAGPTPEKTRNWSPQGMQAVADGLALGLADRDREVRAEAIAGLAQVGPDAAQLLGVDPAQGARPPQPGGARRRPGQDRRRGLVPGPGGGPGRRRSCRAGPRRGAARAGERARPGIAPRPAGIDLRPEGAGIADRRGLAGPGAAPGSCRPTTWRRSWRVRRPRSAPRPS